MAATNRKIANSALSTASTMHKAQSHPFKAKVGIVIEGAGVDVTGIPFGPSVRLDPLLKPITTDPSPAVTALMTASGIQGEVNSRCGLCTALRKAAICP